MYDLWKEQAEDKAARLRQDLSRRRKDEFDKEKRRLLAQPRIKLKAYKEHRLCGYMFNIH